MDKETAGEGTGGTVASGATRLYNSAPMLNKTTRPPVKRAREAGLCGAAPLLRVSHSLRLTVYPAPALSLLLALTLAGCDRSRSGATTSSSPSAGAYAGSKSCESCHTEIYQEWRESHHARAQRKLYPSIDMQAFEPPREIKHGTQASRAFVRDGKYVLETVGSDGVIRGFEPVEALGVDPLWQYLVPAPGGRLQVTELAFDPAKKEWFDVYGEEDRRYDEWGHWSQRGMNWNSMCAICHNTALRKNYDPATDSYHTQAVEMGVGCEQCHGPMQAHVDWQENNEGKPNDPTIVKRDWGQYFGSCAACHSRRGDLTGNFQVGEKFFDHYELILPDLSNTFYPDGQNWDEDFEIAAFSLSYMHEAGIRCTDCHSSHRSKIKMEHNDLCMRCHAQPVTNKVAIDPAAHGHHPMDKAGSKCVDCHMPQTPYMMRHQRRDHGMTIPDPLLTKEHGIPNACNRCHTDQTVDWSIEWVDKWYGDRMNRRTRRRAQVLARLKAGDHSVVPEALALLKEEHNPTWRAVFAKFLSRAVEIPGPSAAPTDLQRAMLRQLDDDAPQAQAAAIEALEPLIGTPAEAVLPGLTSTMRERLEHPSRLVRVKAAWALRRTLPRDSLAGRDLLTFMNYNQDQPTGAFRWAQFLADTGDPRAAIPWYEKAIAWDQRSGAFRHAYATLLDQLGRLDDAIMQAAKAVELEPHEALHSYALGLLYAEAGRMDHARQALRAAVEREPTQPRYWYNLALASSQLGDLGGALEAIQKAEALEPSVAAYPLARAGICRDHGKPDLARVALQRVLEIDPNHPQARSMLGGL